MFAPDPRSGRRDAARPARSPARGGSSAPPAAIRPRRRTGSTSATATRESGEVRLRRCGHTIVVVDDSEDLRVIYHDVLTTDGWHVRAFASAQEALVSIESDPPDVVMTDINLSGLTGRGLARALRANPSTEDLLIVAASGSVAPSPQLLVAFDEFLVKPVDVATLSSRLRSLVDARPT